MKRGCDLLTLPLCDLTLEPTHFPVGAELARDDGLTADRFLADITGSDRYREQAHSYSLIWGHPRESCRLSGRHRRQASSHILIRVLQRNTHRLSGRHRRNAARTKLGSHR